MQVFKQIVCILFILMIASAKGLAQENQTRTLLSYTDDADITYYGLGMIKEVALSPNGKWMVTYTTSGRFLWDLTGNLSQPVTYEHGEFGVSNINGASIYDNQYYEAMFNTAKLFEPLYKIENYDLTFGVDFEQLQKKSNSFWTVYYRQDYAVIIKNETRNEIHLLDFYSRTGFKTIASNGAFGFRNGVCRNELVDFNNNKIQYILSDQYFGYAKFSDDNRLLATFSEGSDQYPYNLFLYDVRNLNEIFRIDLDTNRDTEFLRMTFMNDNQKLLLLQQSDAYHPEMRGDEVDVYIIDVQSGEQEQHYHFPVEDKISMAYLIDNGTVVLTKRENQHPLDRPFNFTVEIFDLQQGLVTNTIKQPDGELISSISVNDNGIGAMYTDIEIDDRWQQRSYQVDFKTGQVSPIDSPPLRYCKDPVHVYFLKENWVESWYGMYRFPDFEVYVPNNIFDQSGANNFRPEFVAETPKQTYVFGIRDDSFIQVPLSTLGFQPQQSHMELWSHF